MPDPTRHPRELLTQLANLAEDPRAKAAINVLSVLLPDTAARVREAAGNVPQMAEAVAVAARERVAGEASALDRRVSRAISGALDELLTAGGARTKKAKRLTQGSKSRARQAARSGR
jgi:hypothetical protein